MSKKFKRQGYKAWKKIGEAWRKPRGRQSKQRRKEKSKLKMPNIGYGKTKKEEPMVIHNLEDLKKVKNKIIISSRIGLKKLLEISKIADKKGLEIVNRKRIEKAKQKNRAIKIRKRKKKKEKKQKKKEKTKKKKVKPKKREKEKSKKLGAKPKPKSKEIKKEDNKKGG